MLYLLTLIPGIPLAIATIVSIFYPLTNKKMEDVHKELEIDRIVNAEGKA